MMKSQVQTTISSKGKIIKYLTIRGYDNENAPALSLAPAHSDQVDNQTILNSLVATLVKFGTSGKIEPYLAEKWIVSDDSKRWQFFLKDGFSCESGIKIDAEQFKKSLLQNFRRNLEKSDKTEFHILKGWSDFIQSKADKLDGLHVEQNSLIFEFDKVPNGFLNFLRMPYFGMWCPDNFQNGLFQTDSNFSSSGAYKVERYLSKSRILLSMRKEQPSYNPEAPQYIEIGYGTVAEMRGDAEPTIGKVIVDGTIPELEKFEVVDGPPLIFQGLVLHPTSSFFSNETNRKVFARRLLDFQGNDHENTYSKGLYLGSRLDKTIVQSWPDQFEKNNEKLKIALQYLPSTEESLKNLERLFGYVFSGISYELVLPDLKNPNWVKSILNNNSYALRTASVYAGARPSVSVIKMMFCSQLGISFPDPSSRVCDLVQKYSKENKDADDIFEVEFNRIIVQDSVVFPLYHAKDRWYISDKIDIRTMPTSIIHPLFEKIRFK